MSRARSSTRIVLVYAAIVTVFFLSQQLGRGTHLFADVLTKARIAPFSSLGKLAPQLLGCIFAARCARSYERSTAAQSAWLLVSAWLGCWFTGQLVLTFYDRVLGVSAPVPSVGDLFFALGYLFVIAALWIFASAYRASGFAVGGAREHAVIALGACAAFAVVGYVVLMPIAVAPTPIAERLVNVGYPMLDLVMLIPALVLLRITIRFRGGRVWGVWGALLAGIVMFAGGDVVFADISPENVEKVGPLADLLFIVGYTFCAYGTRLQYELLALE